MSLPASMSDPQPATTLPGKREAILAAATGHFTRFGYRRTSMDDIARAAGVAKGTLYLYFDSKAAVFRAMQLANFDETQARCQRALTDGASFLERLNGLLQANYGWMHAHFGGSEFVAELGDARSTVGADIAELSDKTYSDQIIGLIHAADQSGEISLQRSGLTAEGLTATVLAAARGAKSGVSGGVSPDQYAESLKQIAMMANAAVTPGG